MDQQTIEHLFALWGIVSAAATAALPCLRFFAARTETHLDDDAVGLLEQLVGLTRRVGVDFGKPKA